ncbi:MAG: sulfatase [Proteobacteria bacterium]|nr:sulfatase [Pseudomonadota bacterium]
MFLFTVDTLRADRTSTYGHTRSTTPFLSELAEGSAVFEQCQAPSSWTVPSLASLHTGQHAWTIGMHDAPSLHVDQRLEQVDHPALPESTTTLAERLSAEGYATHAVVSNRHLVKRFGWAQGFDTYRSVGWAPVDEVDPLVQELAESVRGSTQPSFVWIHLFDPHDPYFAVPGTPWLTEGDHAASPGTPGELVGAEPEAVERALRLYDGEIRDADSWLRRASEVLGVGDDDVVLFASDHGEAFGERGHFGHRRALYQESIRVPCVLRAPSVTARREPAPVGLRDMHQSLLAAAGVDVSGLGRDVRREVAPVPVFSQLVRGSHTSWAVRDGNQKQIRTAAGEQRFDLAADPGERTALAPNAALSSALDALIRSDPPAEGERVLGPKTAELEALGYVDPAPKPSAP